MFINQVSERFDVLVHGLDLTASPAITILTARR